MLVRSPKSRSCAFMLDGTAVRVRLDRIHGGKGSFGAFTLDGIEFALFKQPRREAAQFGSRASVVSRVRRFGSQGGRNRPQLSVLLTIPRLRTLLRGSRCVLNRRSALSEDIGSVLKGVVKVRQRQLVNECSGLLLRSSFAILAARARHLFSARSMPAFSVASRPSNSSDIVRPAGMGAAR